MFFSNKAIYFLSCFCLLFFDKIAAATNSIKSENKVQDFLSHKDLRVYLISLERIIDFSYEYRGDLDLNFSFGLFLVNVNLKPFSTDNSISAPIRRHLKSLLKINDNALYFFNEKQKISDENNADFMISSLFKNDKSWSRSLKKFKLELTRGRGFSFDRNQIYPDWRAYVKNVDDIDSWEPSPRQSDFCMASLAETEENRRKCRVPDDCNKMLIDGTNFGYGLSHRLLFLLFSRFGRGCTVFSSARDQRLRQRFCKMMHMEAEYIADNGYGHVDLMFEQIALCTLDGHANFLRRSWLTNLLRYQTFYGCFGLRLPNHQQDEIKDSKEVNWKHDVMNGTCNGHLTAVAAASIASAVRFILETVEI